MVYPEHPNPHAPYAGLDAKWLVEKFNLQDSVDTSDDTYSSRADGISKANTWLYGRLKSNQVRSDSVWRQCGPDGVGPCHKKEVVGTAYRCIFRTRVGEDEGAR